MCRKYLIFFFFIAHLFLFTTIVEADSLALTPAQKEWLSKHKTVRVGIDRDYAPYSFVDDNGHVKGVVKEYLDILEKKLGIHFELISNLSWVELIEAVKQHKIDAIATVVKLPERESFLAFSIPYIKTPLVLTTRRSAKQIRTTDDLLKLRVALVRGYSSSKQIVAKYPQLQVMYVANILDGLEAVASNEADAFVGALGVSHYLALRNGINNLKVNTAIDMKSNAQSIGVRKDWPELAVLLSKALASIDDETKEHLMEKYLGDRAKKIDYLNSAYDFYKYLPIIIIFFVLIVLFLFYTMLKHWKQKQALELELLESKKLFEYFMDTVPYLVIIKDENFNILYANKMAKKYSPKISKGTTADENLDVSVAQEIDALEREAILQKKAEKILNYYYENKTHILRALSFAIPQEDGKNYVGTVYVDITEQKKMADAMKEQEELMIAQSRHAAMGEMISMIAHQWRQPLSVIAMGANNILIDIELDNVTNEALQNESEAILKQTQYLSRTIDDFRNFFKPDKDKESVLVEEVFSEALSVISKSLQNSDIEVQNIFDNNTEIAIYSRELLQVFLNLFKNAKEALVEYRDDGRKITNTIYETNEEIVVEVCDNGSGIKDDIISKIFDPYFSTKDEKNGTGLGLYMSKIIVEKHLKGKLELHNKTGCVCFVITIPKEEKE